MDTWSTTETTRRVRKAGTLCRALCGAPRNSTVELHLETIEYHTPTMTTEGDYLAWKVGTEGIDMYDYLALADITGVTLKGTGVNVVGAVVTVALYDRVTDEGLLDVCDVWLGNADSDPVVLTTNGRRVFQAIETDQAEQADDQADDQANQATEVQVPQVTQTNEPATIHTLNYLGNTIDAFDTIGEAFQARTDIVAKIMADELPDFLGSDDFDSVEECKYSFTIETMSDYTGGN